MIELRVAGLWVRRGTLLLAEHEKRGERYWVVPGGHVEEGETLAGALAREFLEEVGIEVRVGELVLANDVIRPGRRVGVDLYLAVTPTYAGAEPRCTPSGSLCSLCFFAAEALEGLNLRPGIAAELASYVRAGTAPAVYLGPR